MNASTITLGAFTLAPELVAQIDNFQAMPVGKTNLAAFTGPLQSQAKIAGDAIFFGADPDKPAIGDLKVRFEAAPPATASVIAREDGNQLLPYAVNQTASVSLLKIGNFSTSEMVAQFAKTNSQQRLIVFIAGGVIIFLGGVLIKIALRR